MKSSLQNVIEQHEVRDTGRGHSHTLLQIVNGFPLFLNDVDKFRYRKSSHDAVLQLRVSQRAKTKAILYSGA